jgi:acyl-CoA thioesterase FadM
MARQNMWFHSGITDAMYEFRVKATEKATREGKAAPRIGFVLASSSIRYRKEMSCFQRFRVLCRIVGWDHKSFYLEEIFVSTNANTNEVCINMMLLLAMHKCSALFYIYMLMRATNCNCINSIILHATSWCS